MDFGSTYYQERGYGGDGDGLVSTEIRVADEGADQGSEVASSIEDVEGICGRDRPHVEHCC